MITRRATSSPCSASWATTCGVISSPAARRLASDVTVHAAERRERPVDHGRRVAVAFQRAALAERIHRGIVGRVDEDVSAFAAATVFAFDERVADDDAAADAGAEREQHEAVVLLAGAGPELAVGGRVGVVGERDRHARGDGSTRSRIGKSHQPGRLPGRRIMPLAMSIGPGVAMPARTTSLGVDLVFFEQAPHDGGHAAAGVFGAFVLLGGHRLIRERLAGVIDQADLDIRAADIDADEERLLGGGDCSWSIWTRGMLF